MLQATPLAPSFGAVFPDLVAAGPVQADVALFLPIKDFERRVVTVQADLAGVTLRHRQQPFEATDIAGGLWVRNREIEAPALTGRALGGRWQASIATAVLGNGNLRTRVNAAGNLQAAALAPIARMPSNAGLVGTTDWRGSLDVERNADARQPARGTVELSSDLRGLASALPAPFGKAAEASRAARAVRELRRPRRSAYRGLARARRARAPAVAQRRGRSRPSNAASSLFGGGGRRSSAEEPGPLARRAASSPRASRSCST